MNILNDFLNEEGDSSKCHKRFSVSLKKLKKCTKEKQTWSKYYEYVNTVKVMGL